MVELGDAVGQFGGVVIGQQEAAGSDAQPLGLQEGLGDQQVGGGHRLPRPGVVLADPGLGVAEFIEPAQGLQVPLDRRLRGPLRRMRRHREISQFHGCPPVGACLLPASWGEEITLVGEVKMAG